MDDLRIIPGFPGYLISGDGKTIIGRRGRPLSPSADKDGYLRVGVVDDEGKRKKRAVHTLVCLAFVGPKPSPKHEVAHGNGIRRDNRFQNLRWDTSKGNHSDRKRHGTAPAGALNGRAKLTPEAVNEIRSTLKIAPGKQRLPRGMVAAAAIKFGVDRNTISSVAMGRTWPST